MEPDSDAPRCESPFGSYAATFTLRESEGTCDAAKAESHDPIEFDQSGRFVSPADSLIACRTTQTGCSLAVRCAFKMLESARAALDAELTADAVQLSGVAVVEGTYKGCRRVVYDVVGQREQPIAHEL